MWLSDVAFVVRLAIRGFSRRHVLSVVGIDGGAERACSDLVAMRAKVEETRRDGSDDKTKGSVLERNAYL